MECHEEEFTYAVDVLEAGFLIVKVRWYKHDRTEANGDRIYIKERSDTFYLSANVFCRLDAIKLVKKRGSSGEFELKKSEADSISTNYRAA